MVESNEIIENNFLILPIQLCVFAQPPNGRRYPRGERVGNVDLAVKQTGR
jgi:hypothetical protein